MTSYNATYDKWAYNQTLGALAGGEPLFLAENSSLWLQAKNKFNATYDKWAYNQTSASSGTFNSSYDALLIWGYNQSESIWHYNMSDGTSSGSFNSSYDALLPWGYNQTYTLGTYNVTYDAGRIWFYNQTTIGSGSSFNATYDGYNTSYGKFWYNQTGIYYYNQTTSANTYTNTASTNLQSNITGLNTTYNKFWYNMSTQSSNDYNHTLATYNLWNTFWLSTYNTTYDTWLANWTANNKWWYNMTTGFIDTSFNATYDGYNVSYGKFWNNQSLGVVNEYGAIWNSTYNATYNGLNVSYNKWWYNMTVAVTATTFNATYEGYNTSYGKFWINQSLGVVNEYGAVWNSTYNATYNGLNVSYNKWWYNMTVASTPATTFNATYDGYNTSYGKFWINQTSGNLIFGLQNLTIFNITSNFIHSKQVNTYSTTAGTGVSIDGTSSPGMTISTSGTIKLRVNVPTSAGSYSPDSAVGDVVFRTDSTSQRIIFNMDNGATKGVFNMNNSRVNITRNTIVEANVTANMYQINSIGNIACPLTSGIFCRNTTGVYIVG